MYIKNNVYRKSVCASHILNFRVPFLKFSNPTPFMGVLKLHLNSKAFISHSQICFKTNIFQVAKNIEPNLSLDILIKLLYSQKKKPVY